MYRAQAEFVDKCHSVGSCQAYFGKWPVLFHRTRAQDALADAATQWERITDELGRDKQQAAYTRSIGLEP